jgi:uncharacterized protein YcgI (DUF1989 family)
MKKIEIIPPRSAVAFSVKKGDRLVITDILGEQVCDFTCYNLEDRKEYLSSGRTIDYAGTIFLTKGHSFYSNRSSVMFRMVEDTVGRHDFLLTPCSTDTFRIIYGQDQPHHGCHGNLVDALTPFGICGDDIPVCFNIFMHVTVNGYTGRLHVLPPKSKAGDHVIIQAEMDLVVGMTACSAGKSNNFSYKPIGYEVLSRVTVDDLVEYHTA